MNTDIRLSVGFWQHPKTKKLTRRLGLEAVRSLQILWLWCAVNRPGGQLSGMDNEDIELAADWQGEENAFVTALCSIGFLDGSDGNLSLHGWQENNTWAAASDMRSDASRLNRMAKTMPKAYKALTEAGIKGISKEDYAELTTVNDRSSVVQRLLNDRSSMLNECLTTVEAPFNDSLTTVNECLTNDLSPAPSPAPSPTPMVNKTHTHPVERSGNEDHARSLERGTGGVDLEEPGLEFLELRQEYDHVRPEGPLDGFQEYKQLKAARDSTGSSRYPGNAKLIYDFLKRKEVGFWNPGYEIGLARYLRTHLWEKEIKARASPTSSRRPTQAEIEAADREVRERHERLYGPGGRKAVLA